MNKLPIYLISIFLTSCLISKYPTPTSFYGGVFQSCQTDSTVLTVETLIKLKTEQKCRSCVENKYLQCNNLPEYIDYLHVYPSNIIFDFKKKTYTMIYGNRPSDPTIKYGDEKFRVAYSFDISKLIHNTKTNTWTLKSEQYNWTRTFEISYSKLDDIVTLKAKKGN
ncbi:MAG: hypothetical protein V4580_19900 [Bacteroidota bacterium]